jgi:hypothetical protein
MDLEPRGGCDDFDLPSPCKETDMTQTTKRTLGILAAAATLVVATGGVIAAGGNGPDSGTSWYGPGRMGGWGMMGGPGMMGPGMMGGPGMIGGPGMMMSGDPVAYTQQELTELKTRLGITPAQETAWNAYASALLGRAGLMTAHRQVMLGSAPVTPEQGLTFHQQGMAQMQQVATATRDLYAVLTPEQQAKASSLLGTRAWTR